MAKVLTIRDPQTGYLIAEEWLGPEEDTEAAVARVFRKTLGSDASEQMVNRSVSLMDRRMGRGTRPGLGSLQPDARWPQRATPISKSGIRCSPASPNANRLPAWNPRLRRAKFIRSGRAGGTMPWFPLNLKNLPGSVIG